MSAALAVSRSTRLSERRNVEDFPYCIPALDESLLQGNGPVSAFVAGLNEFAWFSTSRTPMVAVLHFSFACLALLRSSDRRREQYLGCCFAWPMLQSMNRALRSTCQTIILKRSEPSTSLIATVARLGFDTRRSQCKNAEGSEAVPCLSVVGCNLC